MSHWQRYAYALETTRSKPTMEADQPSADEIFEATLKLPAEQPVLMDKADEAHATAAQS